MTSGKVFVTSGKENNASWAIYTLPSARTTIEKILILPDVS